MSFLKSLQISDGTTTTEFVAQESSDMLMPKADPSDPDITVAEKIAALETMILRDYATKRDLGKALANEYVMIRVTTTTDIFEDKEVSLKQSGVTLETGYFDNGVVYFQVTDLTTFTVEVSANGLTKSVEVTTTDFGVTLYVALESEYATVNVATTESSLYNRQVTFGTVNGVLNESGDATFYTDVLDAISVSAQNEDGDTASVTVTPTAYGNTYNAILSLRHLTANAKEDSLEGKDVIFSKDNLSKTSAFDNKTASFLFGDEYIGECQLTSSDGTDTAVSNVRILPNVYVYTSNLSFYGKTFAEATWAEIKDMLDAHDRGDINIYDMWDIGDERPISINPFDYANILKNTSESTNTLIIVEKSAENVYVDEANSEDVVPCHYVVQFKYPVIHSSKHVSLLGTGYWENIGARTALNGTYLDAIIGHESNGAGFDSLVKTTAIKSYNPSAQGSIATTKDRMFLLSAVNVFGSSQASSKYYSANEYGIKQLYDYYAVETNRGKTRIDGTRANWWTRSRRTNESNYLLVYSNDNGSAFLTSQTPTTSSTNEVLMPAFCI